MRRSATRLVLSATGAATRERLVKAVKAHRERVIEGIDEDRYRVTVDTLHHIARNLSG